ncbi:Os03g0748550, partial [Oryza sativa Japonica Group]
MYLPWCSARASSSSDGGLEPSPEKTPAPYGDPPRSSPISNIPSPKVYPIGTNSIPWCASCVIAVQRGGFLAAGLGAGADEEAGWLAGEALVAAERHGGVEEGLHLRRHGAEPGREAEEEPVGVGEPVGVHDGDD